ncbi:hypothetical protein EVAR_27864_1 [Eumeta japonica]|uniref:Uncharacterized protein n=1 Tax=Eumeta variegata TaxID=151549 RepID=A0A4C1VIA1_EUMVA|nr:hypothetical protein EVAR_27864_1 [Eumeta japonica]
MHPSALGAKNTINRPKGVGGRAGRGGPGVFASVIWNSRQKVGCEPRRGQRIRPRQGECVYRSRVLHRSHQKSRITLQIPREFRKDPSAYVDIHTESSKRETNAARRAVGRTADAGPRALTFSSLGGVVLRI